MLHNDQGLLHYYQVLNVDQDHSKGCQLDLRIVDTKALKQLAVQFSNNLQHSWWSLMTFFRWSLSGNFQVLTTEFSHLLRTVRAVFKTFWLQFYNLFISQVYQQGQASTTINFIINVFKILYILWSLMVYTFSKAFHIIKILCLKSVSVLRLLQF